MPNRPLDVYLKDHLAGAMFGADLACQLARRAADGEAGRELTTLAQDIEADRETLRLVMGRLEVEPSRVKQASTWMAEKLSRIKLSGLTAGGERELGLFMAMETLSLGIEGKASLWTTLQEISDRHPALTGTDFRELTGRARDQRRLLERERAAAGARAFCG